MRISFQKIITGTLLLAVGLLAANPARACGDIQPQRVVITGTYDDDSGTDFMGNSNGYCHIIFGSGGGTDDGRTNLNGEAYLYPGKVYGLSYTALDMTNLVIGLTPPAGYNLYINGVLKNSTQVFGTGTLGGPTYTGGWSVELRAKICGDPPGYSPGLQVGDVIWEVGLGQLNNGDLAGKIVIHEGTFTTGLFNRTALNCMATSPDMEVITSSGLRQVRAPQTLVNVTNITNGFQLDFYAPIPPGTALSGGVYPVSGSPFVSYAITTGGISNHIKVVRMIGAGSQTTAADYNSSNGSWNANVAAARYEVKTYATNGSGDIEETTIVQDGVPVIASKTIRTYHTFAWGPEVVEVQEDPDGKDYKTFYTYGELVNTSYTKLTSVTGPTGNWVAYDYYDLAGGAMLTHHEYRPWLGGSGVSPSTAAVGATNCDSITYEYATDWTGQKTLLASKIEQIGASVVSKQLIANDLSASANGANIWTQTQDDYASSGSFLRTITKTYRPDQTGAQAFYSGKPYSVQHPDGTMESYVQIQGTYNVSTHSFTAGANSDLEEIVLHGVTPVAGSAPGVGGVAAPAIGSFTFDPVYLIPNQSTETITYRQNGLILRDETYIYSSGVFNLVTWNNYTYTAAGDLSGKTSSNGATYSATYTDGFKVDETDETGIKTTYSPDLLLRISFASKISGSGYSGVTVPVGNIVTQYIYDAESNVLGTVTTGDGGLSLTSASIYNKAGRLTSQTAPGGYVTTFDDSSGGLTQTTTFPGGATKVTTYNLDGQVASVTGTAQVATYYSYDLDTAGTTPGFRSVTQYADHSGSGSVTLQKSDWLGRKALARHPDTGGHNVDTAYTYNSSGQLSKTAVTTAGAAIRPTLYAYSPLGALTTTALDADGNDAIDFAGTDRITSSSTAFTSASSSWWQTTTQSIYAGVSSSTATTVQVTSVRLNGFTGNGRGEVHTTDIDGNVTTQTTSVDAINRVVTVTTTVPNSTTPAQQISYNGMPVVNTSTHGVTTKFNYDGLGRLSKSVDPRKGGIVTHYVSGTSQISQTSIDGGPVLTNYTYGSDSRVASTSDVNGHTSYVGYSARGEVVNRWGDGTAPVSYVYDSFGRMTQQSTYRDPTNSVNWTGSTFPTGVSGLADTTVFAYYGDLPLLQTKTDAGGHATSYAYDELARTSVRTNARGVTATSAYDADTGDLLTVTYSDAGTTPNLAYTYKRTGALATVADSTGTRSFVYDTDLQLKTEQLPDPFYGAGRQLSYTHVTSGVIGRLTQMGLGTSGSPTADPVTSYTYQSDGRTSTIGGNGSGHTNYVLTYGYTANADNLIGSVTNSSIHYTQSRTYHSQRDVLTQFATQHGVGGAPQVQYDYTYNTAGQRISAKQTGSAYADFGNDTYYKYAYNSRGELAQAYGYLGTNITGSSDPVLTGRTYDYGYDNAGNRVRANHTQVSGLLENFTANNLNQITARDNHSVSVQGTVTPGTNVVISGHGASGTIDSAAVKSGNYWGGEALLNNTSTTPAYQSIGVTTVSPGGGTAGADLIGHESRNAFLGADAEVISYDDDGNVHQDGRWVYTWDAENQLTQMVTLGAAVTAGAPNVKLSFTYDALGRRVSRKIEDKIGSFWVVREELRFVYNGWNLVAEMNTSGAIQRYFTWGLDLSGSPTAMGGIGALLMVQDSTGSYLPAYDGSGNVAALLDASTGVAAATYEYSPFGDLLRSQGTYAAANPIRSSTKYTDQDTGLVYYGHRYYSSSLGRFINRDPMQEAGGLNLYGFAGNDPANSWDLLGLEENGGGGGSGCVVVEDPVTHNYTLVCPPSKDPQPTLTTDPGVDTVPAYTVVANKPKKPNIPFNPVKPGDFGSTSSSGPIFIPGFMPTATLGDLPNFANANSKQLSNKECGELVRQMNDLMNNLAAKANPNVAKPNYGKLIFQGFKNEANGVMSTMAMIGSSVMPSGGLIFDAIGAQMDFRDGVKASSVPEAALGGVLAGASASQFLNTASETMGRGVLLTGAQAGIARGLGVFGATYTVFNVVKPALNAEYNYRMAAIPATASDLDSIWVNQVQSTLNALVKAYNDGGCGKTSGKK